MALFGIGIFNGQDFVFVKRLHRLIEGLVCQVIGVVAFPKVYLSGQ